MFVFGAETTAGPDSVQIVLFDHLFDKFSRTEVFGINRERAAWTHDAFGLGNENTEMGRMHKVSSTVSTDRGSEEECILLECRDCGETTLQVLM